MTFFVAAVACAQADPSDCMDFTFRAPVQEWEADEGWCDRYAMSKAWDVARSFIPDTRFTIVSTNCERIE